MYHTYLSKCKHFLLPTMHIIVKLQSHSIKVQRFVEFLVKMNNLSFLVLEIVYLQKIMNEQDRRQLYKKNKCVKLNKCFAFELWTLLLFAPDIFSLKIMKKEGCSGRLCFWLQFLESHKIRF